MTKKMQKYDVIIIGAGAAGLTAAIYTARRELKTLVLSMNLGGQAALASEIENYPGSDSKSGVELMKKFAEQAEKFGAEIVFDLAKKIEKKDMAFNIQSERNKYEAKAVILALGKTPRQLNVPGEGKFHGKGVVYCATCDAPLFKGKVVAVVGGGNSSFDAALLLTQIAKKVYLIHRRDEFRAEEYRVEKLKKAKNAEFLLNSEIKDLKGDDFLKSAVIINNKTNKELEIEIEGLFVEIGYEVEPTLFKDLVDIDELNQIKTLNCGQTSTPGVFAAGDVSDIPYKQIVISAGAGAKAALCAYDYINKNKK
ncbi:MAG: thioredoxin-disulfide reductase [Candidatus Berkelbacteria bacterium]|nr:thioredoxin-disulfide reductase [Candidatus Berkelbacteria bacterium]